MNLAIIFKRLILVDRQEAADFLGIGLRTLDRLIKAGKLTPSKRQGKTKPSLELDEEEVRALKGERHKSARQKKVAGSDILPRTVAFRLDAHYYKRLEAAGRKLQMSSGEFARLQAIRSLELPDHESITSELQKLRDSLAQMFYTLMVMEMGVSEEKAAQFINSRIRKES